MSEYIVGIDVGSSKVCAAVGRINGQENLQILGISSVKCEGIRKGVVSDIDETTNAILKCIKQLERMVDIEIEVAYIAIPGGICELQNNKAVVAITSDNKEITKKDVDRALEAAKLIAVPSHKEIIGVMSKQYIIDGYDKIKDPIGMSGDRLEIDGQVVMAKSSIINNLIKSVNNAGIVVKGIDLQPNVQSSAVLRKEEKDSGTVLVDIGAETMDISIYKSGDLCYTSIIPLGGRNITKDISACLQISEEKAEEYKLKYGSVIYEDTDEYIQSTTSYNDLFEVKVSMLTEIIEARIDEMLEFVRKAIIDSEYYDEIKGIVIVGGGVSFIKGIVEKTESILNKSVRIGSPEFVGAASPLFSTAVGIVANVSNELMKNIAFDEVTEEVKRTTWSNSDNENKKEASGGIANRIKEFFADLF